MVRMGRNRAKRKRAEITTWFGDDDERHMTPHGETPLFRVATGENTVIVETDEFLRIPE